MARAVILGAAGGAGGGAAARRAFVALAFCTSVAGSPHCAWPTGPRGLEESIGDAVAFVSPQKPGQSTQPGSGSASTIGCGEIAGPLPSALSHQAPVHGEPARK